MGHSKVKSLGGMMRETVKELSVEHQRKKWKRLEVTRYNSSVVWKLSTA